MEGGNCVWGRDKKEETIYNGKIESQQTGDWIGWISVLSFCDRNGRNDNSIGLGSNMEGWR